MTCLVLALLGTAFSLGTLPDDAQWCCQWCRILRAGRLRAAIFVACFAGEIDDRPAVGLAIGGIEHGDLPVVIGAKADITGGLWSIRTLRRTLGGEVTGTLQALNDTQFGVVMSMEIDEGGAGAFGA